MITTETKKGFVWVDVNTPTPEDIESIAEQFSLPLLVQDELLKKTVRSRADIYPDFAYLILHFPLPSGPADATLGEEIDFIIGKDFLVTIHSAPTLIDSIKERVAATDGTKSAEELFYSIVGFLYERSVMELDSVAEEIGAIEESIFTGKEAEMVVSISEVNRRLIDFRQSIQFHKEAFMTLHGSVGSIFSKHFPRILLSLVAQYEKITYGLESHRETLRDLRETNDSLLTTKTNMTMKKLTVLAFITFPLTLISGIFGMNTSYDPILGRQGDFFVIMGIMAVVLIAMTVFFKIRKWM